MKHDTQFIKTELDDLRSCCIHNLVVRILPVISKISGLGLGSVVEDTNLVVGDRAPDTDGHQELICDSM